MKIPLVQRHGDKRVINWLSLGLLWLLVASVGTAAAALISWLLGWFSPTVFIIASVAQPLAMVSFGVWSGLTCPLGQLHPRTAA